MRANDLQARLAVIARERGLPVMLDKRLGAYREQVDAVDVLAEELGVRRRAILWTLAADPFHGPAPALPPDPAADQRVKDLEREVRELRQRVLSAEAIREIVGGLLGAPLVATTWQTKVQRVVARSPGVPTLDLGDFHWGEVVQAEQVYGLNSYDSRVARRRLQYVVDKALTILGEVFHAREPELVVVLGGDMVSGDIHEDLRGSNDQLLLAAVMDCAENLAAVVEHLTGTFERVHVVGVPGNHGRLTVRPRVKGLAETNCDWLIYMILAKFALAKLGDRVTWNVPLARDAVYEVAGRRFRVTHGDQFRSGDSLIGAIGPTTRGDKRKRSAAISMPGSPVAYDTLVVHHFHQTYLRPVLLMNGSLKGYDELAVAADWDYEPPTQNLWLTHPQWGITYYVPLIADPEVRRKGKAG